MDIKDNSKDNKTLHTPQRSGNNTFSINNEYSRSDEVTANNTLSESLRINLFKNMENMKKIFKQGGIGFDQYLDKNEFVKVLDKNMANNKKYDRSTADKIFSVIDWNKDGRISV